MAAFYSVIQFVPDPVADERLNAGVIVFDSQSVRAHFIENWGRLQQFANKDVGFLKQFAREFLERCQEGHSQGRITEETIREMAASWRSAIQLTPPRGSLLGLDALLLDAQRRFLTNDRHEEMLLSSFQARTERLLVSSQRAGTRPYTRHYMKRFAIDATQLAFVQRGGPEARRLVKRDFTIAGEVEDHPFSLAIANGKPLVAAEVFSFVGTNRKIQEKDVRASAWTFDDVKKRHGDLVLAALVLPGDESSRTLEDARKIFRSLGVEIVPKDSVDQWAEGIAVKVLGALPSLRGTEAGAAGGDSE
jgi:hypothetical protein